MSYSHMSKSQENDMVTDSNYIVRHVLKWIRISFAFACKFRSENGETANKRINCKLQHVKSEDNPFTLHLPIWYVYLNKCLTRMKTVNGNDLIEWYRNDGLGFTRIGAKIEFSYWINQLRFKLFTLNFVGKYFWWIYQPDFLLKFEIISRNSLKLSAL